MSEFVIARRRGVRSLTERRFVVRDSVVVGVAGAVAGLASLDPTWQVRVVSTEVLALIAWLALAILGHAHKIVPFIAWSTLRARGVTHAPDGAPLLFAHLFHHPTARATFVVSAAGLAAALVGTVTGTAELLRGGGGALALAGALAIGNLALGPLRVERSHRAPASAVHA